MRPSMRAASMAAGALCIALSASACAGAGGGAAAGDPNSINVLMVNNPQMEDLQRLTADSFTKETGIKVNYTVLPENDVRAKISQEFSSQAGQYDVASLSNYEIPFFAANKWLAPLDTVAKDPKFNQADILPAYTASLTGKGRQALRRTVLWGILVPDVPQGHPGRQGPDHAGEAHLGRGS
jgi:sorbitol/mannitol transport system substrate-binding protein